MGEEWKWDGMVEGRWKDECGWNGRFWRRGRREMDEREEGLGDGRGDDAMDMGLGLARRRRGKRERRGRGEGEGVE